MQQGAQALLQQARCTHMAAPTPIAMSPTSAAVSHAGYASRLPWHERLATSSRSGEAAREAARRRPSSAQTYFATNFGSRSSPVLGLETASTAEQGASQHGVGAHGDDGLSSAFAWSQASPAALRPRSAIHGARAAVSAALWVTRAIESEMGALSPEDRRGFARLVSAFGDTAGASGLNRCPDARTNAELRGAFDSLSVAYVRQLALNNKLKKALAQARKNAASEMASVSASEVMLRSRLSEIMRRASNAEKMAEDWKQRATGWKRSSMQFEEKYKRLSYVAQRQLGVDEEACKVTDGNKDGKQTQSVTVAESDALLRRLTAPTRPRRKKKELPRHKALVSGPSTTFSSAPRFGAGAEVSG
ncbi:hypothetical protein OAN61_00610, partial [bacterium]|nr:hypothetical protein [bacterium]